MQEPFVPLEATPFHIVEVKLLIIYIFVSTNLL